jgi:methylglyoxal synthase
MRIALVAHDNRKDDLMQWVGHNAEVLSLHDLICTGTTGTKVIETLTRKNVNNIKVTRLKSGPLGGDQELGAKIANNNIDLLVFFWDPMSAQPHDPDVKALLRLAVVYNIPTANNRATADYIISSKLFNNPEYRRIVKDYSLYLNRKA